MSNQQTLPAFEELFEAYNDYPQKGITFFSISKFLEHPQRSQLFESFSVKIIKEMFENDVRGFDAVVILCTRGNFFAHLFQDKPVYRCGKQTTFPHEQIVFVDASKEYGKDIVMMELNHLPKGSRCLVLDDILVSGQSIQAVQKLLEQLGSKIVHVATLLEVTGKGGRELVENTLKVGYTSLYKTPHISPNRENERHPKDPVAVSLKSISSLSPFYPKFKHICHQIVLFPFPSKKETSSRITYLAPDFVRLGNIEFDQFPDGFPNISIEHEDSLKSHNKIIVYMGSLYQPSFIFNQLSVVTALCGQNSQMNIVDFGYLAPQTHERITNSSPSKDPKSGMIKFEKQAVATAHCFAKQLTGAISGPTEVHVFDLHAKQEKFYFPDVSARLIDRSMVSTLLVKMIPLMYSQNNEFQDLCILFLDDGAYKQFNSYFFDMPYIYLNKVRGSGEKRSISIGGKGNWFADENKIPKHFLIVDDLVSSGSSIISAIQAMKTLPEYEHATFDAYVTHAVFPNNGHLNFDKENGKYKNLVRRFYVSNTLPEVTDKLKGRAPFIVLETAPIILNYYLKNLKSISDPEHRMVYIASSNPDKVLATKLAFRRVFPYEKDIIFGSFEGITSNVNNQPFGVDETMTGALNRAKCAQTYLEQQNKDQIWNTWIISLENGLFMETFSNKRVCDQSLVHISAIFETELTAFSFSQAVPVEFDAFEQSKASNFQIEASKFMKDVTNTSDWHAAKYGISRVELMAEAIENSIYSILQQRGILMKA